MKIIKYNDIKNIAGPIIRELRIENGLSQKQLAEKMQLLGVGITRKEISKIENNNRLIQDFELFAFAEIFKVSADVFSKNFKI